MSTASDGHKIIEIDGRSFVNSVAFLCDKKRVVGAGDEGTLRCWEVQDGQEERIAACGGEILAVAISKDGKFIVVGAKSGLVTVWDTTLKKVVEIKAHSRWTVAVDVSPDCRTVATAAYDGKASIWDIATGQLLVGPLQPHGTPLVALKFSTDGNRVATALYAQSSVRIHNAQNGSLLLNILARLSSSGNEPTVPLAWSSDDQRLFAVSYDGNIQCFDTSSGSLLSQWPLPCWSNPASIVLSNNNKFIVASAGSSISFWDASTYSQIGPVVAYVGSVQSIALSSDDSCLVSGGRTSTKITVWNLQNVLPESYCCVPTSESTEMALLRFSRPVSELCIRGDWKEAETALTEEMAHSSCSSYSTLANRALVRSRLQDWNGAHDDAQQSLELQPSVIGYIAKAVARVGQGEPQAGIRAFDLTFLHCSIEEIPFLFLIRTIILFEIGEQEEAMKRIQDLIDTVDDKLIFHAVQAQMSVLRGNKLMKEGDYDGAIKLFERVQLRSPSLSSPHLKTISLIFGWQSDGLAFSVRRQLCEALHATGRMKEAAEAVLETVNTLRENIPMDDATADWVNEFTRRCVAALESMGDAATHLHAHDQAIEQYSAAISLNPQTAQGLYLKRSKARAVNGLWEDAISDANEAIMLDPACPWGYERKHAALHAAQRFDEAIDAFVSMLSTIESSPDESIRQKRSNYITPSMITTAIDAAIHDTFKKCPHVLINIKTGLLCDGPEKTRIFKADPAFKELVSSMTEKLDENRILQVVSGYFQYVMFSHTWEGKEPSFQEVNAVKSVWVLQQSPLNDKLRKFCEVVRDNGYRWAWSGTCCIDKSSNALLSQSLISMYQWYEEAAGTLALLVGVPSPSLPGGLANSFWMTRAWTLLELLASKIIRFYDSEWNPYLNDTRTNHKESPVIVRELANALGVTPEIITNFHPGALGVCEVLRLASTRAATIEEDVAYSLIGILASDITPNYGEGEAALGHLLEEVLTRSGEMGVLAWTGKPSGFNSCFPASTAVYQQPLFMSSAMEEDEMGLQIATLRTKISHQEAMTIYDRISRLPPVIAAHRRLHVPCIVFPVKKLRSHQGNRYYARTSVLGEVEFQTTDDVSLTESRKLYFVHPWVHRILDQTETHGGLAWEDDSDTDVTYDSDVDFDAAEDIEVASVSDVGTSPLIISADSDTEIGHCCSSPLPSLSSVASRVTRDDYTRALRLIVRVEQPFSALLLEHTLDGKFRRVATEHDIIARPRRITCSKDVQTAVLEVL